MLKRLLLVLFMCFGFNIALSQDAQYSMYLASPLYMNPAFAGSGAGQRLFVNHRNQWPNIPISYQTYSISYDINAPLLRSGFAILANGDKAGTVGLKSSQINLIYAYKVVGEGFTFSPAISFGYGHRSFDYNKLIFGDQLDFNTTSQQTPPATLDPALFNLKTVNYMDINAGVLLYNKETWLGFSASHINQANRSFLGEAARLPLKVSIHGGFKFETGNKRRFKGIKKEYLLPSFMYVRQAQFDQLNVGLQWMYEPVLVGAYYRGIAIRQNVSDQMSNDAIVWMLGFTMKKWDIAYSYDMTVSRLAGVSGGAHEIALKYNFNANIWRVKAKKKQGYIPCPAF